MLKLVGIMYLASNFSYLYPRN